MKIDIIDNFLTSYQADSYVNIFNGIDEGTELFPWYFTNNLNEKSYVGNYYFNNVVIRDHRVENGLWLPIFEPLVNRIGISFNDVWRLKVNLYPRTHLRVHHEPHCDYEPDCGVRTCLYYVNNNNGMTVFDGKKKVRSKKNRAILFDGSNKHHSTTPSDSNWRCSINVDFKI